MWLIQAIIGLVKGAFYVLVTLLMGCVFGIPVMGILGLICLACGWIDQPWCIPVCVIIGEICGIIGWMSNS